MSHGETLPHAVAANMEQAAAVFPGLAGAQVDLADAGHEESLCLDGVPIIDKPAADSNLWFAAGWCGHGWAIAPAVSRLMAQWVSVGQCPAPVKPFTKQRFGL